MNHKQPIVQSSHRSSLQSYITGFILSLIFTSIAFFAVIKHTEGTSLFSSTGLIFLIISLAIVQLIVQLYFFLHLGQEAKPRWNLVTFLFMLLVLVIIVFGSLWIMDNLNYNMMMSPEQMNEYMKVQKDKGF